MTISSHKPVPKEIVDRLPKSVGPYNIVTHIGMGGSGVVVLAVDSEANRCVAIKITNIAWFLDKSEEELYREFKILRQLKHPNIVQVLDAGWSNGVWFIAYEYVAGRTLDEVLAESKLPHDYIIEIGIQLADAIQAGHLAGVIHRDIKPANIMVDWDMNVKLLDYGIAKAMGSDEGITQTGFFQGTIGYVAPEQRAGKLDHRSDIYSIGMVLKEMLIGHDKDVEIKIPTDLRNACRKATERNPARRYQSAADLKHALIACRREDRPRTFTVVDHKFRRLTVYERIADATVAMLIVAFLFFTLRSLVTPLPPESTEFRFNPHLPVSEYFDDQGRARIFIDANRFADIYISQTDASGHQEIVAGGVGRVRAWLRPGDYLVTAIYSDGSFSEVLRTVPHADQQPLGLYPNTAFEKQPTGLHLAQIQSGDASTEDAVLHENVYFDSTPLHNDDVPGRSRHNGFRVQVSLNEACKYLESHNKRLPFAHELRGALPLVQADSSLGEWTMTAGRNGTFVSSSGTIQRYRFYRIVGEKSIQFAEQFQPMIDTITFRGVKSKTPLVFSGSQ